MLNKMSDVRLTQCLRSLRDQMRPYQNELVRRGYTISEVHGHSKVPVTGFENIIVSKKTEIKL